MFRDSLFSFYFLYFGWSPFLYLLSPLICPFFLFFLMWIMGTRWLPSSSSFIFSPSDLLPICWNLFEEINPFVFSQKGKGSATDGCFSQIRIREVIGRILTNRSILGKTHFCFSQLGCKIQRMFSLSPSFQPDSMARVVGTFWMFWFFLSIFVTLDHLNVENFTLFESLGKNAWSCSIGNHLKVEKCISSIPAEVKASSRLLQRDGKWEYEVKAWSVVRRRHMLHGFDSIRFDSTQRSSELQICSLYLVFGFGSVQGQVVGSNPAFAICSVSFLFPIRFAAFPPKRRRRLIERSTDREIERRRRALRREGEIDRSNLNDARGHVRPQRSPALLRTRSGRRWSPSSIRCKSTLAFFCLPLSNSGLLSSCSIAQVYASFRNGRRGLLPSSMDFLPSQSSLFPFYCCRSLGQNSFKCMLSTGILSRASLLLNASSRVRLSQAKM